MTSNMYMYIPIRKQINIMSIKGGLDTKVVLILRWSLICCGLDGVLLIQNSVRLC